MNAAGVLPNFHGVAVHDAWAPYDTYRNATHALCNAHVLRELQAVTDHNPPGQTWCWARQTTDALVDLKNLVDAALATNPQAKHNTLARRLIKRETDYLRFTTNPLVPFDNNAAEREIRMIKLRQKVSGCLRTLTGAEQFCAIRSYLATAAKHNIGSFDALTTLAEDNPWMPTAR